MVHFFAIQGKGLAGSSGSSSQRPPPLPPATATTHPSFSSDYGSPGTSEATKKPIAPVRFSLGPKPASKEAIHHNDPLGPAKALSQQLAGMGAEDDAHQWPSGKFDNRTCNEACLTHPSSIVKII